MRLKCQSDDKIMNCNELNSGMKNTGNCKYETG